MTPAETPDPSGLSLDELRESRCRLQLDDDAVSYARRIAQARLDLVAAEQRRRGHESGNDELLDDELRAVLSTHLTNGPARPPRPTEDLSDHPLALELDERCSTLGFSRLQSLDAAELVALGDAIAAFEARVSADRRALYDRLDPLSAELVRRYRDESSGSGSSIPR